MTGAHIILPGLSSVRSTAAAAFLKGSVGLTKAAARARTRTLKFHKRETGVNYYFDRIGWRDGEAKTGSWAAAFQHPPQSGANVCLPLRLGMTLPAHEQLRGGAAA